MATACSIRVRGVVQGVGFRPFVYRLAQAKMLAGWVLNGEQGVEIHLEGTEEDLAAFVQEIKRKPPAAAQIAEIRSGIRAVRRLERVHDSRKRAARPANRSRFTGFAGLRRVPCGAF